MNVAGETGDMNVAAETGDMNFELVTEHLLDLAYSENVANHNMLYSAFCSAVELLQFVFAGYNISFNVLGSAAKGTAIRGDNLDIDVDMVFPDRFIWENFETHVLDQNGYLSFVQFVCNQVRWAGVFVSPQEQVTRSFSLRVHSVTIEIFPKYRSSSDTSRVISFGGVHNNWRPALGNTLPVDYEQGPFADSNNDNSKKAIVILKLWKSATDVNLFKSYHLTLLAQATFSSDSAEVTAYFGLPQNGSILLWVIALWRRIIAVRAGGAQFVFNGQSLDRIDYTGLNPNAAVPIQNVHNINIPLPMLLGGVTTIDQLYEAAQRITFRVD